MKHNIADMKEMLIKHGLTLSDVVAIVYAIKPNKTICNFIFAPNDSIVCSMEWPATQYKNTAIRQLREFGFQLRVAPNQPEGTPHLTLDSFRLRAVK